MAGPLKIKTADITSGDTIEGLQELSASELKDYTANIITTAFAGTAGVGSIEVTSADGSLTTNFSSIGTFTNRVRVENVGDHPAVGTTTTEVYTFGQNDSTATDNKTFTPLRINSNGEVAESTDSEIDSEIIDELIDAMITDDANTAGQYWLAATAPAGGTWVNRGQVDDTQTDGTTVTKYLWQKTAATTVPSSATNRTLIKFADDGVVEATDAELQSLTNRFRNRIISNNIGTYEVVSSAPGTGTWQQKGETLTDQLKTITDVTYTGGYTGAFTGSYTAAYTGSYIGTYNRAYAGTYSRGFTGAYTGYYTGAYTGYFTGSYTGYYTGYYTGSYSGAYTLFYGGSVGGYFTGAYAGTYAGAYAGTYSGSYSQNFSGAYAGTYSGSYTGAFTGSYTAAYSGAYAGTYNQAYAGTYSRSFTGTYVGATVQATSSTQESKKLFLRIA